MSVTAARSARAALLAALFCLGLAFPGSFAGRATASPALARQPETSGLAVSGADSAGTGQAATAPTAAAGTQTPMWTRFWQVRVRKAPGGPILTELDRNQEVRVIGGSTAHDGTRWQRVRLWGALEGYIEASLLAATPLAVPFASGSAISPHPVGPHAPMPLRARAVTIVKSILRQAPDLTAPAARSIATGTTLVVTSWATDGQGKAWYGAAWPAGTWIAAGQVRLLPGRGTPDLAALSGPGMWLTPPVLEAAPPEAIVAAARQSHITHLYLEVGGSNGFYGGPILNRLLPVAHRADIAVVAWVYPFLDDLPLDVSTALAAARYVTPSGERPDGLAADVEQNMAEPYVRAYGQIVRARLGPKIPMIIAVYPPQSYWGKLFPFPVAAQSWDIFAPMDYWHITRRPYSKQQAYAYVTDSIAGIRTATGSAATLVEPVGQMYDAFGDGRHSPTAAEIRGAIGGAVDGHASGISFFEWNHATPQEWDALQARYSFKADTKGTA